MAAFEDFDREHQATGSSDRAFGLVFAAVFAIVGLRRNWAFGVAAAFLFIALARPSLLGPLNRVWTKLGLALGKITNPIVTAIVFFGVFTPFAVVMRAFGKDPLRLRLDPAAATYWIERDPPGPAADSMGNQF